MSYSLTAIRTGGFALALVTCLACGGGKHIGAATLENGAALQLPVASSATGQAGGSPSGGGEYYGFGIEFSTAQPGGSCDTLGNLPAEGNLGGIRIVSLGFGRNDTDVPPGTYAVSAAEDPPADGGMSVTLLMGDRNGQIQVVGQSGTVTIASGTGGWLRGSYDIEADVYGFQSGGSTTTSATLKGTFDAPPCF
jgi:hypothetical protein